SEVAHTVVAFDEAHFGIEVLSDATALGDEIHGIRAIAHRTAGIVLPATQFWRARQNSKTGQYQILVNDKPSIQSASLVVWISRTAGTLVHVHPADVGITEQRALEASHSIIRFRIWARCACADVHQPKIEAAQFAG